MKISQKGLIAFLISVIFLFAGIIFRFGEQYFIPMWMFRYIGGMGFATFSKKS